MSVSAWVVVFSLIITVPIGIATHWIVGAILFFMIAGKALVIGLILDTISGSLEYHHDRNDQRMKKIFTSIATLKTEGSELKQLNKIKNIRR